MGPVSLEMFRCGPITRDHAAHRPGYAGYTSDAYPVPVPTVTVSAATISKPLLADG